MTTTILPTRNEAWGFYGTSRHHVDPDRAWPLAFATIAEATGASPEGVRDFLDSRHGRHFADDVASGLADSQSLENAITAAIDRWMGWRIGRKTHRETGIPVGLPYLTGFVTHFEILAEADTVN
ncbi:MAG: hypothetical protein HY245_11815 [Rhizobiales bacterium]|nr:hypothetical protein [Hyphomicrobiales bacterium]